MDIGTVANGATRVRYVTPEGDTKNSDVVNGVRPVVRGKPGSGNEAVDEN
jgi:hypothetical protein